jgi:RNA polymerase sigma-70 factor (ECF subfamily)
LHERTSTRVYGYVRRHCDEADCDDVIDDVYLVAWRRFHELPSDPIPWLLGTARRVLANLWRSRSRRERLTAELAGVAQLAAPDCATQAVERADLLTALAAMSPNDREILLLVGWDGLTSEGAAAALGISRAAAHARLSRARRRLARQFEDAEPEAAPRLSPLTEGN